MNAVIPWLGPDSTELRYSLRSIETFLPDITGIIIIGYSLPNWIKNVSHIKFRDRYGIQWAHKNVWDKVNLVEDETFLFHADDHYLLKQYTADKFPNYFNGTLSKAQENTNISNPYFKTITNTLNILSKDAIAYNTHAPFIIEKKRLKKLRKHDWTKPFGYCLKSLYCHKLPGGVLGIDLKLRVDKNPDLTGREWFSTSPVFMSRGGERLLKKLYPKPSKWEA